MKRLIGTFCIAFMLLFALPFTVYAEEVLVESEDELINNLTSNYTLILGDDISIENVIQIIDKQDITIDLNGFNIKNTNDCSALFIQNCQNIKVIDSSEDNSGAFLISLTNGESFEIDSPYKAINVDNSTVSIEDIKIDFTSENKGVNAQLFNLSKKSELQLIDCDITTNNIGKVIEADNSKVYLGKNNEELAITNLPDKLTKVTVENLVVPSLTASGIQTHTGAIYIDNDSLIEVFADICLKSYVVQTDDIGREGSVVAILSNNSAVNICGGTVENRCEFDTKNSFSLYAIEAYKPSETNGLVISYKANEFDEDRKYGTELISNQDTIFVSPVEMGSNNYENQSDDYKITLDYASIVSGDRSKAITSISKYENSGYSNIVIDSKCSLIYGNVIYRQGLNDSATEDRDNKYSYFAFCNDDNDDSNDKYIVLTRSLEIGEYRTLNFEDVNVVVASDAKLNVLGAIENNKASGVNNSKLQINGQYELRGKCDYDIYVYGKATIFELTNANMYPKENGDIYLDASLVKFILRNKLTYNKERQTPVFDAYFGNRLVKELSPGNTIEFEQDKQFKVSGSSSSIFVFAGNGKIVDIIRINNSSTNSHFYMTDDTTTTFDIEKADYLTLNPGKNLRADINIKAIKYGYKESVSLKDFLYDDDKREYQWYREVNGEQIKIQDECEYEYIIRAEDIGNKIYCQVSFGNYKDVITSDKVTVGKGTGREITFPDVSEISYPQKISEAILTGGNTNGTFAWENPDEILVPGTYTRNLIFTPNDSNLYDYSDVTLTKAVSIKVNKGVPSPIVFPEDANVDYPSPVRNAIFTGVSTNGTFTWENPDEQLPPGTYTRKIIFTPNDSDLYDYTSVELIKEVQLTVNKADPQSIKIISKNISGLTGSRKITLCYQVYNKLGVDTPTGKIKLINRVTDNGGTQTDEVIAELDLVYGKTEQYTWNIANDNNFTIIAQYSGDDYYNSLELSTTLDTRRKTPVITISDIGQKTYGDTAFCISGSALLPDSTDNLPMTYASSDMSILSIQGNVATIQKAGRVVITAKVNETEEYLSASKQVELIVNKKTISFTADNKEIMEGAVKPEYTYADVSSQLVGNDKVTTPPSVTCDIKNTKTPGIYEITIEGAVLDNNDCYDAVYTKGKLTIKAKKSYEVYNNSIDFEISGGTTGKVDATISGNRADLAIDTNTLKKLSDSPDFAGTISFNVQNQKGINAVRMTSDTICALAQTVNGLQKVRISFNSGTLILDAEALDGLAKAETKPVTFSIQNGAKDPDSYDAKLLARAAKKSMEISIMIGGTAQKKLAGEVAVEINADALTGRAAVYTVDENGEMEYAMTYLNGDVITFYPSHFSPYYVVSMPFADIPENTWYNNDVAFAYLEGLLTGTSDTTFSPDESMTRAMLVTALWRKEGKPQVNYAMSFSDIAYGAYYTEAVRWAASERIVDGYNEIHFGTDDKITREQLITILYRYAACKDYDFSVGEDTNMLDYKDTFDISKYAIPAMQWACGADLIKGADGNLMPSSSATRAQVAAMLHRFEKSIER